MRHELEDEIIIQDLIEELEALKVAQSRSNQIIARLEAKISRLSRNGGANRTVTGESKLTLEQYKRLIGRRVRLVNPHKGEPDTGTITGVGKLYITVRLTEELSRNRQAKNLRLLHYEE